MKNLNQKALKLSGIIFSITMSLFSCGHSREEMAAREYDSKSLTDSVSAAIQNSNNTPQLVDSNRTFVRTADLSFKVKDVKLSTFDIEKIVSENNGYITFSGLESTINSKSSTRTKEDSVCELTNYTVHNDITIRIPSSSLDKTLSETACLMDYLDYRRIKADDVTSNFQESKLSENRFIEHKKRLEKAIDQNAKKLDQTLAAENDLLAKQEWADDSRIKTLELTHDVAYSSITIHIYQNETFKKEMLYYSASPKLYVPPFGIRVLDSISYGLDILLGLILFVLKVVPVLLLVVLLIIGVKYILKQKWILIKNLN